MANPALIYEYEGPTHRRNGSKPPAPLILLHDGGGTTFSYHCLYPIGRTLYGIQNARLDEGGYWEGGIPGMARHYIKLIESILPQGGEILLGGWSLGGLLSLEMAAQLAARPVTSTRPRFTVLGMIFIDSIYPKKLELVRDMPLASMKPVVIMPEELRNMKLRDKVDLNMTHARLMVARWDMPDWTGREDQIPPTVLMRAKEFVSTRSQDENNDHGFGRNNGNNGDKNNGKNGNEGIREGKDAAANVNLNVGANTDANENENSGEKPLSLVDYAREFRMLGWDQYGNTGGKFIQKIVDIEGHHFSVFHDKHIRDITRKIAAAADWLDQPEY
ncbi:Alpha/Beta hydrolase protein [Biscogniauxia marginata]|nr:Alpha/Beta hydrolase protein [Biscogniauxia marginata]